MIRLYDIPQVRKIEGRAIQNRIAGVAKDHDLDRMVLEAAVEVFGDCLHGALWEIDIELGHEGLGPVAAWRKHGFDITGPDGEALECYPLFEPHMACVVEGIDGFRTLMEVEADLWKQAKSNDNARCRQDAAFLNLGQSRGRKRA